MQRKFPHKAKALLSSEADSVGAYPREQGSTHLAQPLTFADASDACAFPLMSDT